jgi:hypothetical protein
MIIENHNLRWRGKGMMDESAEFPFKPRSAGGCPGLCNDKVKRRVAIAVAMDCETDHNMKATFFDIDCVNDTPRRNRWQRRERDSGSRRNQECGADGLLYGCLLLRLRYLPYAGKGGMQEMT